MLVEMVLGRPPDLFKLSDEVRRSFEKFSDLKDLLTGCSQILLDERFEIAEVVKIVDNFFQMSIE